MGVGIVGMRINKFKGVCHCTGCRPIVSCRWGLFVHTVVDAHEVEVTHTSINDNELNYVSKHAGDVN